MHTPRPSLNAVKWRKSSYSNATGGNCVEVAINIPDAIPVRDTKNPHGPTLVFPTATWAAFTQTLKP